MCISLLALGFTHHKGLSYQIFELEDSGLPQQGILPISARKTTTKAKHRCLEKDSSHCEVVPEKGEKKPTFVQWNKPPIETKVRVFPYPGAIQFTSSYFLQRGRKKLGWKIVPRLSDMNRGPPHFEMVGFMQIKSSLSMKSVWARERPLWRVWKFLHEITYVWLPFFEQLNLVICFNSGVKCNSIWIKRVSILQRLF